MCSQRDTVSRLVVGHLVHHDVRRPAALTPLGWTPRAHVEGQTLAAEGVLTLQHLDLVLGLLLQADAAADTLLRTENGWISMEVGKRLTVKPFGEDDRRRRKRRQ